MTAIIFFLLSYFFITISSSDGNYIILTIQIFICCLDSFQLLKIESAAVKFTIHGCVPISPSINNNDG